MQQVHEINELMIRDYIRINEKLSREVLRVWDSRYPVVEQWFVCMLANKWQEMVMKN